MRLSPSALVLLFFIVPALGQQDSLHRFSISDLTGHEAKYMYPIGSRIIKFKDGGDIEPQQLNEFYWHVTAEGHLQILKSDKSVQVEYAGYVVCGGRVFADSAGGNEDGNPLILVFSRRESSFADGQVLSKSDTTDSATHTDTLTDAPATAGETIHVSNPQTSIKSLEVYEIDSGLMLGKTSEVVLTVTPGDTAKQVAIRFVSQVGNEMSLSRDEALRFIHVRYPNWYVVRAEITFEDKSAAHDGGSIGAALGSMVLSTITGFKIDPDVAITGDISANGKVRAIGGLSAKLRGAAASKCTLVAVPTENYDQLVDAVTYSGVAIASDVQVIGIANLDDAVAVIRSDRDQKLTEAAAIFATVQYSLEKSPDYLKTGDAQAKLEKVLELAPQHLSAKVLLAIARGRQPQTLSATATQYYTFLAARNMIGALNKRADSPDAAKLPSAVLRNGLAELRKLRPLADPKVRPLVDAWTRFVSACNEFQQGDGSSHAVESQRQLLLDEMSREDADPGLMQQMLKEGF